MKILRLALVGVAFLLAIVLASPVYARGGVFVIQPNQEAVQSLPSLNPDESAAGNFSATGPIDFYVLGPNGTLLLFYNHRVLGFQILPRCERNLHNLHGQLRTDKCDRDPDLRLELRSCLLFNSRFLNVHHYDCSASISIHNPATIPRNNTTAVFNSENTDATTRNPCRTIRLVGNS
jgi:hypothetical protein